VISSFLELAMSTNPYQPPQIETPKPTPSEKPKPGPIPAWAWVFIVACGIIPVLTLGGAIPGAIGFGGAGGCLAVSRDAQKPVGTRVALCAAITVACYAALFVLLVIMAAAKR
jgi:hypothetical protein